MTNYTSAWFRDKLFETTLEDYKSHFHVWGREECDSPERWVEKNRDSLSDQYWIHKMLWEYEDTLYSAFGDTYESEFEEFIQAEIDRYIDKGELETYIHNQMEDYCRDLAREL